MNDRYCFKDPNTVQLGGYNDWYEWLNFLTIMQWYEIDLNIGRNDKNLG